MRDGQPYITFKYNILFAALSNPQAKGVLFFDEMNLAPNMIKAQFYKIINDRAIGDIPISEGVLCVSAGNEAEHSRGVTEDPIPLVLRRGNYFLRPLTSDEFLDYAVRTQHHPWIVGYLGFNSSHVHKVEYDGVEGAGQACPRMWTRLSSLLTKNPRLSIPQIKMFATGFVGQATATTFIAYVKQAREVKVDEILKNPALDKDVSMLYAVMAAIVEKYRANKKAVTTPALSVALNISRPEYGTFLVKSMKSLNPATFSKDTAEYADSKVLAAFAERFLKYVQ
jgi:hypothetical protein